MQYHAHAALTATQRITIQTLYRDGQGIRALARRFGVHPRTIARWVHRTDTHDHSSAPHHHGRQIVTTAYRAAVIAERRAHPTHGPQRIADALRGCFPTANRTTIWRILHAAGLSQRTSPKKESGIPFP